MVKERDSIVAFIDILGFKEVMLSDDFKRREKAIQLLERISSYGATYGVLTESLGIGEQVFLNAEVTTFSDNVVLSAPIGGIKHQEIGGEIIEPASSFLRQVVQLLISIYWQGLYLGLLFRGAITTGRLYHDSNVVAGEGLVNAVRMEKETRWPRIEVDPDIINKKDERGLPLLEKAVRDAVIIKDDGRFFLNTLGFHIGVWWDYNHFEGKTEISWDEVKELLKKIRDYAQEHIDILENSKKCKIGKELDQTKEAQKKWVWFRDAFDNAQAGEDWQQVLNTQSRAD